VPSRVRLWLDARTPDARALRKWREGVAARAGGLGVSAHLATASESPGVVFDPGVRAALGDLPEVTSFAGHDAGILAARVRTGMVFVRNERGISHAPEAHVELEDAAVAATALARALEALA
jgi:beta-ureidopropionase / N-carbamoyl-L-amino-acid hydrolase